MVETAADLAVAAALISSLADRPIDRKTAFFGEMGLSGEVRPVPRGEERAAESVKLGFTHLVTPSANKLGSGSVTAGVTVSALQTVAELYTLISDS